MTFSETQGSLIHQRPTTTSFGSSKKPPTLVRFDPYAHSQPGICCYRYVGKEDSLMAPLFVLVISLLLLRGVGFLGVRRLSSWREAGLIAVVIMFLFTGATHFSGMKHDYAAMLPGRFADNLGIIYLTGALQIA